MFNEEINVLEVCNRQKNEYIIYLDQNNKKQSILAKFTSYKNDTDVFKHFSNSSTYFRFIDLFEISILIRDLKTKLSDKNSENE